MALKNRSLFLYGYLVTSANQSLDFRAVNAGPILQATLTVGAYSLTDLLVEVARAMGAADPANTYTATAVRNIAGGLENRVSIATSGAFLSLLFASGPRTTTTCAALLGFAVTDRTGATSYAAPATSGTGFSPTLVGYNFLTPQNESKVAGNLNISASGEKEAVVFSIQQFWTVQFKFEPAALVTPVGSAWSTLFQWLIQQRPIDFTPDLSDPGTFYNGTLEKSAYDGKGLGYQLKEMLPDFPDLYDTGPLTFRLKVTTPTFIG